MCVREREEEQSGVVRENFDEEFRVRMVLVIKNLTRVVCLISV